MHSVTGGVCIIGVSALGKAALGTTLGGNIRGQNNKYGAASFRGVRRPQPNLFGGRLTHALSAHLGGRIGGFTGGAGGGRGQVEIRPSLVTLVARRGDNRTLCGRFWLAGAAGGGSSVSGSSGVAAASEKMR